MNRYFNSFLHQTVERILESEELNVVMQLDVVELEREAFNYILDCTPPEFSLWTSDRVFVTLNRKIWQCSPVLIRHSAVGEYHQVEATQETVRNLDVLFRTGVFPRHLDKVLELIALVKYLDIEHLLKLCFDHFCVGIALHESQDVLICRARFPKTCQRSTVLRIWELVCTSPMRSKAIYRRYFRLLQNYSQELDFIQTARNIMMTTYNKFEAVNLGGVPVDFGCTSMLTGLFTVGSSRKTAVITQNSFVIADIFGRNFGIEYQETIRDYYLVYNSYIIYRNHHAALVYQNLKVESRPTLLATNIIQFLHKVNHLFLLSKSWFLMNNQILRWTRNSIIELIPHMPVGERIDFCIDSNVLCYETRMRDTLCLDVVQNSGLVPFRQIQHGCVHLFVFYRKKLCVWGKHGGQMYDVDGNSDRHSRMPDMRSDVSDYKVVNEQLYIKLGDDWYVLKGKGFVRFCPKYKVEAFASVGMNPYQTAHPF